MKTLSRCYTSDISVVYQHLEVEYVGKVQWPSRKLLMEHNIKKHSTILSTSQV